MTVDELRAFVRLDEATGYVYFIQGQWKGQRAVKTPCANGYLKGMIGRKWCLAHRVVWALHTGEWPQEQIDHINHDKTDNRPENLRPATAKQNCRHRRSHKGSSSRFVGVTWAKDTKKWQAAIKVDGKQKYLGQFAQEEDAALAYNFAARDAYGDFARVNVA